ncbi:MAG TPA: dTDP-4-dehydrorhamnose reductase [Anaerovoracaceae bacterium]|nr:dTDP-4-dehydrorhamnose reductase [Anaerovoracaceae bacterium]
MRVLVTGVKGQLGFDMIKELKSREIECLGTDIEDFDITNAEKTNDFIVSYKPDAVIHCSAYTAVDKAEDEPEMCREVNTDGPRNIAKACKDLDAKMVYISTDYVFPGDGDGFYETGDPTGPICVYGQTKLDGESAVKETLNKYFIVRISWVFGLNGNNFIKNMLKLSETRDEVSVVSDQVGSVTYTADLAPLLCDMVATKKYGTYHATNEGTCSWAELAEEAFRIANRSTKVNFITTDEYPTRAMRPKNSRLSKKSLDKAGFLRLPEWEDAVKRYISELEVL